LLAQGLNLAQTAEFQLENGLLEKSFADLGSNLTLNFGKLFVGMEEPEAAGIA
jgi:hypothetical protein